MPFCNFCITSYSATLIYVRTRANSPKAFAFSLVPLGFQFFVPSQVDQTDSSICISAVKQFVACKINSANLCFVWSLNYSNCHKLCYFASKFLKTQRCTFNTLCTMYNIYSFLSLLENFFFPYLDSKILVDSKML